MNPANEQSQTTYPDLFTSTPLLELIIILAILTATTWLTIRSSSEPSGILHGARVWSRNHFNTRANPRPPRKQDISDDNSDDDVPYGVPGLFDDQTESSKQEMPESDSDNIEDDVPYGPGLFDRPSPAPRTGCSCESPHSDD
jgi:hypothetical protein